MPNKDLCVFVVFKVSLWYLVGPVILSCILGLSPVATNRLLGALLRWAVGSNDK